MGCQPQSISFSLVSPAFIVLGTVLSIPLSVMLVQIYSGSQIGDCFVRLANSSMISQSAASACCHSATQKWFLPPQHWLGWFFALCQLILITFHSTTHSINTWLANVNLPLYFTISSKPNLFAMLSSLCPSFPQWWVGGTTTSSQFLCLSHIISYIMCKVFDSLCLCVYFAVQCWVSHNHSMCMYKYITVYFTFLYVS